MEEKGRKTGISVIDAVPWGTHLCQFYETKQDLLDILVPYFKAGLENNEFCMWITEESFNEEQAKQAMREAMPDFGRCLEGGRIEIVPYTQWYLKDGVFSRRRVLNAWSDKLNQALHNGYDGMRVTGNLSWLRKRDWRNFNKYEEEMNNVIGKNPMLAMCAYSLSKCGANEIIDVAENHRFVLIRRKGEWELVQGSESKRVERELNKFRIISDRAIYGAAISDLKGNISYVNESFASMHGYTVGELIGKHLSIFHSEEQMRNVKRLAVKLRRKGSYTAEEVWHKRKDNTEFLTLMNGTLGRDEKGTPLAMTATCIDIFEGKRAEEALWESQESASPVTSGWRMSPLEERFIRSGFEGFSDQQLIEVLLSLVLPPRQAKNSSKQCVEHFKNLRGLLAASPQELQQVGVPPHCVCGIKLLHELPEQVLKARLIDQPAYNASGEFFDYLRYSMQDLTQEVFKVIYTNNQNRILHAINLFEGTLDSVSIRPREIVESAMEHRATALVFAHNHPTGDPKPSKSDKQLTRDLVFTGMIMQIRVLDHIVIGGDTYFSFADAGLIQKYEDDFLNLKIRATLSARASNYLKSLLPFIFLSLGILAGGTGAQFF
jgi:DNA repair protein RadC